MPTPEALRPTSTRNGHFRLSSYFYNGLEMSPGHLRLVPRNISAEDEVDIARYDAVRSARHMLRSNPQIAAAITRNSDMTIGGFLQVLPSPDFDMLGITNKEEIKKFKDQAKRAFFHWANNPRMLCDAEGHNTFGGLMRIAYLNSIGAEGESFGVIHFRPERREKYNTPWGTFIQLIDPMRVEDPPALLTNEHIRCGIKQDEFGRMIGFYVKPRTKKNSLESFETDHAFVPRETYWGRPMSWHHFDKRRAGQHRGMTSLVTILKQSYNLKALDDNHVSAAALAALYMIYVKTTASAEAVKEMLAPATNSSSEIDQKIEFYREHPILQGQRALPVIAPNDEIAIAAMERALQDPTNFRNNFLREFASATGTSFEQLSQNYSEATYAAQRAALIDVWRGVMARRWAFYPSVVHPCYSAVLEEAIELGVVEMPESWPPFQENRGSYDQCTITGPGMGWIDPLREANAIKTRMAIRLTSPISEAAANGGDFAQTIDEWNQAQEMADDAGLVLEPDFEMSDAGSVSELDEKPGKKAKVDKKGQKEDGDQDGLVNE